MPNKKRTYRDYRRLLDSHGLLGSSQHKALHVPKCEYIVGIFGRHSFNNILEIGRSMGHSFGLFRFLSPESYVVSIDIKHHKNADKVAALFDDNYLFIDGTSDDLSNDVKFDFVLIDGAHSYEWCKKDWQNIQGKLAPGCVVVLDDILQKGPKRVFEEIENIKKEKRRIGPCGNPLLGIVYVD